jgi:hypothetical protein
MTPSSHLRPASKRSSLQAFSRMADGRRTWRGKGFLSTALKFRACLAGLDKCRAPKPLPFLIPTSPELLQPYSFLLAPHNSLLLRLRSTPLSSPLPSFHRKNAGPQNSPLRQSSARASYHPPRSAIAKVSSWLSSTPSVASLQEQLPRGLLERPLTSLSMMMMTSCLLASLMSPSHSASKQAENPHDA